MLPLLFGRLASLSRHGCMQTVYFSVCNTASILHALTEQKDAKAERSPSSSAYSTVKSGHRRWFRVLRLITGENAKRNPRKLLFIKANHKMWMSLFIGLLLEDASFGNTKPTPAASPSSLRCFHYSLLCAMKWQHKTKKVARTTGRKQKREPEIQGFCAQWKLTLQKRESWVSFVLCRTASSSRGMKG